MQLKHRHVQNKEVNMYNVNNMLLKAAIIENESSLVLSKDGNNYAITAIAEQQTNIIKQRQNIIMRQDIYAKL